jgi:type IV pilus assembly protein PilV
MSELSHMSELLHMSERAQSPMRLSHGFSMVEVLVALVVTSVGLLGLAKMESLSLSSTGVAAGRSIAAIEASSLAAAMHANRAYWAAGLLAAPATVSVVGATVAISDPGLSSVVAPCTVAGATACTPDLMAAYDVQQWAASMGQVLPASLSTISCSAPTVIVPTNCTIQIQWAENAVALNAQQTNMGSLQASTYVLYVQP